jgi:hypothetical protein
MTVVWKQVPSFKEQRAYRTMRAHAFLAGYPLCHVARNIPEGEFVEIAEPPLHARCFTCYALLRKRGVK